MQLEARRCLSNAILVPTPTARSRVSTSPGLAAALLLLLREGSGALQVGKVMRLTLVRSCLGWLARKRFCGSERATVRQRQSIQRRQNVGLEVINPSLSCRSLGE